MNKENLWNKYSILFILLGIACILIKALLPETIDASGILHEHFYLLPIGFLCLFIGLIILFIMKIKTKK